MNDSGEKNKKELNIRELAQVSGGGDESSSPFQCPDCGSFDIHVSECDALLCKCICNDCGHEWFDKI